MSKSSYAILPGGLSEADHDKIFALAEKGVKPSSIARRIQKHPATVRWFMYRNGLASPRPASNNAPADRSDARGRKVYSAQEDAFIWRLRVAGTELAEIARRTTERFGHPRTRHSVEVRLVMLSARETPPEDVAA